MIDRFWDKNNEYTEGFLKEYKYWALEVNYRQHTLGCFVIFAKRRLEKISELSSEEILELREVMAEIEKALLKADGFKPDRFNYFQMGNKFHDLHFHGLPRYALPRNFAGKEWIDETYGSVPVWTKNDVEHELVVRIRDTIKARLSSQ
jgi:diadenosine tetraphosphate (Ap4A) HIT family hydrolase